MLANYKAATDLIRSEDGIPDHMYSILSRRQMDNEEMSRTIGIICFLDRYCKEVGIHFKDIWDNFCGKHDTYARNGVHLSLVYG